MCLPTIVWDIDDVLNKLTSEWYAEFASETGIDIPFGDLRENPAYRILNISKSDYLNSLDSFREREFRSLKPREEVLFWFKNKGHCFRNIALTAVPLKFANLSAEWLFRHFGTWFRDFHLVPSYRDDGSAPTYDIDKAAVLKRIAHVDYFIDDSRENVMAAAKMGINAIFFPAPWNEKSVDSPDMCLEKLTKKDC